jgi:hypothetical protein
MRRTSFLIVALLFLVSLTAGRVAYAQQSDEPAKIEIGIQFSSFNLGPQTQSWRGLMVATR